MVSCHAIASVHDKYIGDPLDIEMFMSTKWSMDEESERHYSDIIELVSFHSPGSTKDSGTFMFLNCPRTDKIQNIFWKIKLTFFMKDF